MDEEPEETLDDGDDMLFDSFEDEQEEEDYQDEDYFDFQEPEVEVQQEPEEPMPQPKPKRKPAARKTRSKKDVAYGTYEDITFH